MRSTSGLACAFLLLATATAQAQVGEAPPNASEPPSERGVFSLGLQVAADAVFNDPVVLAHAGVVFHFRLSPEWSFRTLLGYGYAPGIEEDTPIDAMPMPGFDVVPTQRWDARHTGEVRPSVGYLVHPAVEARLFVSARVVSVVTHGTPDATLDVGGTPITVEGRSGFTETFAMFGGGTEWIFRPEDSRRLELGVLLGLAGRTRTNPDGSHGVTPGHVIVHGAVSVGWLFF